MQNKKCSDYTSLGWHKVVIHLKQFVRIPARRVYLCMVTCLRVVVANANKSVSPMPKMFERLRRMGYSQFLVSHKIDNSGCHLKTSLRQRSRPSPVLPRYKGSGQSDVVHVRRWKDLTCHFVTYQKDKAKILQKIRKGAEHLLSKN